MGKIVGEDVRGEIVQIRVVDRPCCEVCGSEGKWLYRDVRDCRFNAPGEWSLKKCPEPRCGLVWLDPMPAREELHRFYDNYLTHADMPLKDSLLLRWFRRAVWRYLGCAYGYPTGPTRIWERLLVALLYVNPEWKAFADTQVMFLPSMAGGRLLEVGCGGGILLNRLQRLGWQTEGVDFDPVAVENARAKGLVVRVGDVASQRYPEGSFDVIVVNHVIEHVPGPKAELAEYFRILKPGGRVVGQTPNVNSWGHQRYGQYWRGLEPPRHLQVFSSKALEELLRQSDFRSIECRNISLNRGILRESRSMKSRGSFQVGQGASVLERVWVNFLSYYEWFLERMGRDAQEIILFMARKS